MGGWMDGFLMNKWKNFMINVSWLLAFNQSVSFLPFGLFNDLQYESKQNSFFSKKSRQIRTLWFVLDKQTDRCESALRNHWNCLREQSTLLLPNLSFKYPYLNGIFIITLTGSSSQEALREATETNGRSKIVLLPCATEILNHPKYTHPSRLDSTESPKSQSTLRECGSNVLSWRSDLL